MDLATWQAVEDYFEALLVPADGALESALQASTAAGLPPHQVTPSQGQLLQLLAQIQGARTILEIGTLGGYSTIWLARGLPPEGRLITLEVNPVYAQVATRNIARAHLADRVDVRLGAALETLPQLESTAFAPFDLIFIDADKPNHPAYLSWALRLARPGTIIIGDNVVRNGEVANAHSQDPRVQGVRQFCEQLAATPAIAATAVQTVGSKGYDGFVIARVQP